MANVTTNPPAPMAGYISAMMKAFSPESPAGLWISSWLRANDAWVGFDFRDTIRTRRNKRPNQNDREHQRPLSKRAWSKLCALIAGLHRPMNSHDALTMRNLEALASAIGLSDLELAIFRFVLFSESNARFSELCSAIVASRAVDSVGLLAIACDVPPPQVWVRLLQGPLRSLNLVDANGDGASQFHFYIPGRIEGALLPPNSGLADVERKLIGTPLRPQLEWSDFDHVAAERDFVTRLLRGAVERQQTGVNILLHGPPGTGKTEFCKTVAARLGLDLFAIGEVDEDGDEPTRDDRIAALRLGERLAARRRNTLLLFDEMEDVLQHGDRNWDGSRWLRRAGSKVYFNRLLEQNRVPVLWTTNNVCEFDPAFLRRMSFTLEMKAPPLKSRADLWSRSASARGIELTTSAAADLARRHKVPPSMVSSTTRAVATAKGGAEEIDFVVTALAKPLTNRPRRPVAPPPNFEPALTNADTDLAFLEERLCQAGAARDFSLCLYGPPGTGKSAFARRLAIGMGLDAMIKRGSDLLSMWVGETERLIADAFEEAARDERFLIIDEAESVLWDRAGASRSWEASMVNELLVAMESHPLPFACTTNLLDRLEPATLRRFTFKVKFDYLDADQAAAAYRFYFGAAAPAGLRDLGQLTPGDFAAVAKKQRVLGDGGDRGLLRLLEQEVALKPGAKRRIGF
jgi:MoxR-like ATPase